MVMVVEVVMLEVMKRYDNDSSYSNDDVAKLR